MRVDDKGNLQAGEKGAIVAVKMSKESLGFVKGNPRIVQVVGSLLYALKMAQESHNHAVDLFLDGKGFEPLLAEGFTLTDLRAFLKDSYDAFMDDKKFHNLGVGDEGDFEEAKKKLQEKIGADKVVATRLEPPTPPSNEGDKRMNSGLN